MKKMLLAIVLALFSTSGFCADFTYKTKEICANGLSLTFSGAPQGAILNRTESPLTECTQFSTPQGPDDSGCVASTVVGSTIGYEVQLGTLTYADDLGHHSIAPISIIAYANLMNGSSLSENQLTYRIDSQLNMLKTADAPWGDRIFESYQSILSSLPDPGNLKMVDGKFPGLESYSDKVLTRISDIHVYAQQCRGVVDAFLQ